jgi:citrate synthase
LGIFAALGLGFSSVTTQISNTFALATESSISSIDGKNGILAYRGYSIEDLVKYASFEEVAMLLRDGELPSSDALADFQKVLHERYEVKREYSIINSHK